MAEIKKLRAEMDAIQRYAETGWSGSFNVPGYGRLSLDQIASVVFQSQRVQPGGGSAPPAAAQTLPYTYVIYIEDGVCKAQNGFTGEVDFQNSDHAVAIQDAINMAGLGGSLVFRPGTYNISAELQPDYDQTWWLQGGAIFQPTGNNRILNLIGRHRLSFHGVLDIRDPSGVTAIEAIRADGIAFCYFERIFILNYYRGMNLYGTVDGLHENDFPNIYMQVRDRGINLETSCHDNHFGQVWIKGPSPTQWATGPGLRIATTGTQGGNSFDHLQILDMYWGMDLPGAYEVWFGSVVVDNAYSLGIYMAGSCERVFFDTVWTASGGDGIWIEGNPNALPVTYADKLHFTKIYTWLNANYGVRFEGYVKQFTCSSLVAQRMDNVGVAFHGPYNEDIFIDNLITFENGNYGVDGTGCGENVVIGHAYIYDGVTGLDNFAQIGGVRPGIGRFTNQGVATILSGQTAVVVTHGLENTPAVITIGPYHSEVANAYVSDRNASDFTISVDTAVTADRQIAWRAASRTNAH